ncbi:Uncharacterised protein [Salmonella enterica subsp. enterica serovar Typhimurium str. DT104]|nr:Uncharacterised protein [Salmonella enterica subsp. enterica serovar Typhimurium str. DT104]
MIAETNFIADAAARLRLQLFGNAVSDGARRQTTRLSMSNKSFNSASQFHTNFRQLGGFTGTGFPCHDHHLMIADRFQNVLFLLANRQILRISD